MPKLKVADLKNLPDGWHADEAGLYLVVQKDGKYRNWVFKAQRNGKRIQKGLGPLSKYSLAEARDLVKGMHLNFGVIAPQKGKETFDDLAEECFENLEQLKCWKKKDQKSIFINFYKRYVSPELGNLKVAKITREDVLRLIEPIYKEEYIRAKKALYVVKEIINFATVRGIHSGTNPAQWDGNLALFLPPSKKVHETKHRKAIAFADIPKVLKELWENQSACMACYLIFTTLTASRRAESGKAQWKEFDFQKMIWNMPPERRKDGLKVPHRVPISDDLNTLLSIIKLNSESSPYLFSSSRTKSGYFCITHSSAFLRSCGYDFTLHGMRSAFRDWAAENGKDFVACEKALSHSVGNAVTQAYLRSDMLEQRRPIMDEWAKFCLSKLDLKAELEKLKKEKEEEATEKNCEGAEAG